MMKILLIMLLSLTSINIVMADTIKMKFNNFDFNFKEFDGLTVEQVQTKLRCHFINNTRGNNLIRSRYPFTQVRVKEDKVGLLIKKSSLTEFLPGFRTHNCSFILLVLGRDENGRFYMGDIAIMGKIRGRMPKEELKNIQDGSYANRFIKEQFEDIGFGLESINGKQRIVKK